MAKALAARRRLAIIPADPRPTSGPAMRHAVIVTLAALLLPSALAAPALAANCSSRLTFVRGVIDRDEQTGFVGKETHDAMAADLDRADQECQAGDDRAAERTISATQRKHGYPVR